MRQFVERQIQEAQVRQRVEEMTRKLGNPVHSKRKGTEVSWFDASNRRSRGQRTAPGCVPVPVFSYITELLSGSTNPSDNSTFGDIAGSDEKDAILSEIEGGMIASEGIETATICKFDSVNTIREIDQQYLT
ncbi:hypothetical protein BLNAU_15810 [Blattamonas nauphoetae]|uniref:Uncharacterized protein n=1 Tax=Blattamonas nauphoetae TaxID=2049346 RepID=A0ABQ9X9I1_9EUKA|nr:hypothetical protein BLNAU_15810 [Blattamonas nauphoetae]